MDDTGPAAPISSQTYHSYSLLQLDGRVSVFVDEAEEEIIAGNVAPMITRETGRSSDGILFFGDGTNDPEVNSVYRLSSITLTPVTSIPEPNLFATMGLALLAIVAARRCKD